VLYGRAEKSGGSDSAEADAKRPKKGGRPKAAVESREETPKEGIRGNAARMIDARAA